jgi:hypothetical protein
MMHLEAIKERNAKACEDAPRNRERHCENAREWTRRALAWDNYRQYGTMIDAAHAEYEMAGGLRIANQRGQ